MPACNRLIDGQTKAMSEGITHTGVTALPATTTIRRWTDGAQRFAKTLYLSRHTGSQPSCYYELSGANYSGLFCNFAFLDSSSGVPSSED